MSENGKIRVEKNFPFPKTRWARGPKYPWTSMDIGDSFKMPEDVNLISFRRVATAAGRNYNRKFSVRKIADGFRCWRTE